MSRLFIEVVPKSNTEFEIVWSNEKRMSSIDAMPMPIDAVVSNPEHGENIASKVQVYADIMTQKYYVLSEEAESNLL